MDSETHSVTLLCSSRMPGRRFTSNRKIMLTRRWYTMIARQGFCPPVWRHLHLVVRIVSTTLLIVNPWPKIIAELKGEVVGGKMSFRGNEHTRTSEVEDKKQKEALEDVPWLYLNCVGPIWGWTKSNTDQLWRPNLLTDFAALLLMEFRLTVCLMDESWLKRKSMTQGDMCPKIQNANIRRVLPSPEQELWR